MPPCHWLGQQRQAAAFVGAGLGLSATHRDQFSPAPSAAWALAPALLPSLARRPQAGVAADLVCVAALLTAVPLTRPEAIRSPCDQTPTEVKSGRIRQARQLALGGLAAGLLLRQPRTLTPLAAAVLSVGLRRLLQ